MSLTITIHGTKEDLLGHLEGMRAEASAAARNATPAGKARLEGRADGIQAAMNALEQWQGEAVDVPLLDRPGANEFAGHHS